MKEQVFVVRGPKGRAHQFLCGQATQAGEWGSRKAALRGSREWAEQAARLYGGMPDAAGWREVPESPVKGFISARIAELQAREEREQGVRERAARKDGQFFGC